MAALGSLAAQQPSGTTRAALLADFQNIQNTIVQGAETLLTMEVDGKTKQQAALHKLNALRELAQIGDPEAAKRLSEFTADLMKSKTPELSHLGGRLNFAATLQAFDSNKSDDAQRVLDDFQKLFAEENKDAVTLDFGNQVASVFERAGNQKEALEVLRMLATAYAGADPSLAASLAVVNERIRIVEMDLYGKMNAFDTGQPNALEQLTSATASILDGQPLGEMSFLVVRNIAQLVESRNPQAAGQIYAKLASAFANHKTPDLAKQTKDSLGMFERRSSVLGQPFLVEGITLNGAAFNWATYKGKVVLIDFWISSYPPNPEERENLKRIYDLYRDQGFEIVGLNLDQDLQLLKEISSLQPLPWVTVISEDPQKRGASHPLVVKCGVESIPFSILVDRNGNTAAVNPPRNTLEAKIQELLKKTAGP